MSPIRGRTFDRASAETAVVQAAHNAGTVIVPVQQVIREAAKRARGMSDDELAEFLSFVASRSLQEVTPLVRAACGGRGRDGGPEARPTVIAVRARAPRDR